MAIDRMDWHYGGDFPDDLLDECGGTHIGMYIAWIINNDLIGELHLEESEAIEKVKSREITGRDFLINECDERFWEDDLKEEGLEFTQFYYSDTYYSDYDSVLASDLPSTYHVEDTWRNYDLIAVVLDRRYMEWKQRQTQN